MSLKINREIVFCPLGCHFDRAGLSLRIFPRPNSGPVPGVLASTFLALLLAGVAVQAQQKSVTIAVVNNPDMIRLKKLSNKFEEKNPDTGERVTSIQLPRPSEKPVIAFAVGEPKAAAVLGGLRGGWMNGLVTDESCARKVVESGS
jgi:hypothetical protein